MLLNDVQPVRESWKSPEAEEHKSFDVNSEKASKHEQHTIMEIQKQLTRDSKCKHPDSRCDPVHLH